MVVSNLKTKILSMYNEKEEKILVNKILDDISRFENRDIVVHTNFLDIHEKKIAIDIMNMAGVKYKVFDIVYDIERTVIFLLPDYIDDSKIYSDYISCIKIKPKAGIDLEHRKCMGSIYSLGISESVIGDIFINDGACFFFVLNSAKKYIMNNLFKVGKNEVILEEIDIYSEELQKLHVNYIPKNIIVSSLRADNILASLYFLSRSKVKSKIEEGDLFINSKQMFFQSDILSENDIVSFRGYGKFKMGKINGYNKSGKILLSINIYE